MTTPLRNKTRRAITAVLLMAGLGLGGCVAHVRAPTRSHPHAAPPHGHAVVIHKGHVHSRSCGHYRHGGKWYYLKGHIHRSGCGHAKVHGVWVYRR